LFTIFASLALSDAVSDEATKILLLNIERAQPD